MVKIRSDQELIEELMKINQNYQSKSNKCVEAENDRRITGLAVASPVPVGLFRSRLSLDLAKIRQNYAQG
jgi:hypothetical protein